MQCLSEKRKMAHRVVGSSKHKPWARLPGPTPYLALATHWMLMIPESYSLTNTQTEPRYENSSVDR